MIVATIGMAAMIRSEAARPDHAAYVAHWLAALKGDSKTILSASRFATQGHTIDMALRGAQLWLRGATVVDLRSWLRVRERSCEILSQAGWANRLRLRLLRRGLVKHDPQSTPLAAPVHWAAFVALTAALRPN